MARMKPMQKLIEELKVDRFSYEGTVMSALRSGDYGNAVIVIGGHQAITYLIQKYEREFTPMDGSE